MKQRALWFKKHQPLIEKYRSEYRLIPILSFFCILLDRAVLFDYHES